MTLNLTLIPVLILSLSACETGLSQPGPWKSETVIFSNTDDLFYADDAIAKAVDLFLGEPTNAPPGSPVSGISDGFSNSGNALIKRLSGYQIGAKYRLVSHLTPRLSLMASAVGSIGETTLLLPDGAGILVEPITIGFTSLVGEGQIGVRQNFPITERISAAVSGNIGMKAAISITHINSPVIAIQNNTTFADPYIGAEIEISASPTSQTSVGTLSLGVELRYYRTTGNTISAGIGFKY